MTDSTQAVPDQAMAVLQRWGLLTDRTLQLHDMWLEHVMRMTKICARQLRHVGGF
jgi:hypothetical protein